MAEIQRTGKMRFKLGVFLLILNIPYGIGGAAIAASIGVASGHKLFWSAVAVAIYASSWAMLGLGVLLAGPEGLQYARELRNRLFKKKQ
jgi:hypothetical protein